MADVRTEFSDRVVVISGGSRGIGFVTARAFLERGARVALCAMDSTRLTRAAETLHALGDVETMVADVRDYGQANGFIERVLERFGRIDVLVNNAGRVWSGNFAAQPHASIDEVIDTNLKGALYLTRLVLPPMQTRRAGCIVNVASGAGLAGIPGIAAYSASKFGLVGFTESIAQEVAAQGVRAYVICPGRVATDMQVQYSGARVGMPPERVAETILSLAGPRPPIRSGEYLVVS